MVKTLLVNIFIAAALFAGHSAEAKAHFSDATAVSFKERLGFSGNVTFQENESRETSPFDTLKNATPAMKADTLSKVVRTVHEGTGTPSAADTAQLRSINDSILNATAKDRKKQAKARFVPDPKRALWLSLVFPGAGQIYNRKYWKLPFIYGGFLGCVYAFQWNQQMYRDYSQAYLDIMDDDPNTKSYLDMLPPRYDITGREEQFKNIFKRKKDYYRRYRDLSAFCFIGVYLLSVIDAYVDAQLSVFDISPDLTMRLEPAVINSKGASGRSSSSYGVGCSFSF